MAGLTDGFILMLMGMGVVFVFLILLIIYMKSVPILSHLRLFSKRKKTSNVQIPAQGDQKTKKLKLNSVLDQISRPENTGDELQREKDIEIAAIAAAIYSHTGLKPKKLVITTPTGKVETYNPWGSAGRQDIMMSRDVVGQVGFQY